MNRVLATNLYKGLKAVKRTEIMDAPVLNHVKFSFENGELVLTSTNQEDTLTAKVSCILEEEWNTCVPMVHKVKANHDSKGYSNKWKLHTFKYYPFLDFLKVCAEYEDVLEFTFNPDVQIITIKVQGERSVTEFKCIDAQEFPSL